jgi:hypothetical protein
MRRFGYEITNFLTGEIYTSKQIYATSKKALQYAKKTIEELTSCNKVWLQAKNDFQILVKILHP